MRLLARAQHVMEGVAEASGSRLHWRAVAPGLPLCQKPDEAMEGNIVAQFEAALRTALIGAAGLPLQAVFLLNRTGRPRPAESLMHGGFRERITAANFIATCELEGREPGRRDADDAVVLWIDDLSAPAPFANPYDSRAKGFLHRRAPTLLDALRQRRTDRVNPRMMAALAGLCAATDGVFYPDPHPAPRPAQNRSTVLFCLYWLDFGGAEAFALQLMRAAHDSGLRVLVACDEAGRHRLLQQARQCAEAIYLPGSFGHGIGRPEMLLRIIREQRPDILHIHHSWTAYRLLPTIRTLQLVRRVIDTTHILEHRFGGFAKESALYSGHIDLHHVISHDLRRFYLRDCGLPEARVRLGKLHDLSDRHAGVPGKWQRAVPLRVAFIGRFVQQKRPYLFLDIARRVLRGRRDRFRFQAVGEGELRPVCEQLARDHGLGDRLTFLPGSAPVADILAQAHVLVICSDNEGLALVAFEAIRADCLVVSCDVGGQRELVAEPLLVPRHSLACVRTIARLLRRFADGRLDPASLLARQREMLDSNLAEPTGVAVCLDAYHLDPARADIVSAA